MHYELCIMHYELCIIYVHEHYFDASATQEVDAIGQTIFLAIDDATDASLDDEFGTLDAGRGGDIDSSAIAIVIATGQLRDGISLGMEHVGLGDVVVVLAHVLEAAGRTVITIADDHLVLDHQGTDLTALAVGVLGPDACHAEIAGI